MSLAVLRRVFFTFCLLTCVLFASGCGRTSTNRKTTRQDAVASSIAKGKIREGVQKSASSQHQLQPLVVPELFHHESLITPLADAYRRINPLDDGWDSEAFGEAASAQLGALSSQLLHKTPDFSKLLVSAKQPFALSVRDLNELQQVFTGRNIVVRRDSPSQDVEANGRLDGPEFSKWLQSEFSSDAHVKFKLFRVSPKSDHVETMAYFHIDGLSGDSRCELSSTWTITWIPGERQGTPPRISDVRVSDVEYVQLPLRSTTLFADCTAAIFSNEPIYREQFLRSTDYWRTQLARDYGLDVVANHGMAIGDVNGDMLEDLYICQQGGLPNRLLLQQPDGTLRDASEASGADWLNYSASALLIDFDNDGDKDLAVAHELHLLLMRNDGTGKFTLIQAARNAAQTFSLAAADYDLDGDLDIFCCGYNKQSSSVRTGAMGEPMPYHDAQNGGPNTLWRNQGDGNFVNATSEVGLDANNNRFAFAASWEDFDNDGDPDLYVANDYGRNSLYRNDAGVFRDVAHELGVEDMSAGMSVSWGDINRDGTMDFHVSNMFSAAGNRITYQRQFKDTEDGQTKQQFQRHARGNSLFLADGEGSFRDLSVEAGITMGRWAWASKFCDLNNDGWQDIVVNNGFISAADTGDL